MEEKKLDEKTPKDVKQIFHGFKEKKSLMNSKVITIFAVIIVAGIGVGFIFAQKGDLSVSSLTTKSGTENSGSLTKGTIVGSNDTSTFKDAATGVMTNGGIDGEGQFHLVRPGGDSQNVYLTSSIVDLSKFVGKKVKVNGQTQTAKKAGWLMDVGRVEVLE